MHLFCPDSGREVDVLFGGRGEGEEDGEENNSDSCPPLHSSPIHLLKYSKDYDCVISFDKEGFIEIWDPRTGRFPTYQQGRGTRLREGGGEDFFAGSGGSGGSSGRGGNIIRLRGGGGGGDQGGENDDDASPSSPKRNSLLIADDGGLGQKTTLSLGSHGVAVKHHWGPSGDDSKGDGAKLVNANANAKDTNANPSQQSSPPSSTNSTQQKNQNLARLSSDAPSSFKKTLKYDSKFDTSLFELKKMKTFPIAVALSPNNEYLAVYCDDDLIRVFRMASGKLWKSLDETIDQVNISQYDPKQKMLHLEAGGGGGFDLGKRIATEKELKKSSLGRGSGGGFLSLQFDSSSNFLIYPTLLGIKVVNLMTNDLKLLLGKVEHTERFLGICLYQGKAMKRPVGQTESVVRFGRGRLACGIDGECEGCGECDFV